MGQQQGGIRAATGAVNFAAMAYCWNITSSTVIQLHNALSYALLIRGLKKGVEVIFVLYRYKHNVTI